MANSSAAKRLMKEYSEMQKEPDSGLVAVPMEENVLEWHFTIKGPTETAFEGGIYHGRIVFPPEYPFKPPDIYFLTPNGRFELGKKICLSITGFHEESWRPAWGIRLALLAIISFFPTKGLGAVGALDWPDEARRMEARKSVSWSCHTCGPNSSHFSPEPVVESSESPLEPISVSPSASSPTISPSPSPSISIAKPVNQQVQPNHQANAARELDWIIGIVLALVVLLIAKLLLK